MSLPSLYRIDLRRLILMLSILTAIITFANAIYASYRVQREMIINNTLEANRVYAAKLSDSTQKLLLSTQQQLSFSAKFLHNKIDDSAALIDETKRLFTQTSNFNSTFVINSDGVVLAISPETVDIIGKTVRTKGSVEARRIKEPLISEPYISAANNYVVVQTYPIFSDDNRYLGYVGGAFYLKDKSILNSLLGEHYYRDSSYLYVVDKNKRLIYHPDRVGEVVSNNQVINAVVNGESGALRVTNSKGIDMLAGFAPIPISGWGVVAQKPVSAALVILDEEVKKVIINTIPLAIITLLFIWFCTRLITRPLSKLASIAERLDSSNVSRRIYEVRSWYFEANQIKQALLEGVSLIHKKIDKLNLDTLTDPLTGLYNRRGLKMILEGWRENKTPFSIVALDIDHFKRVNDNFGHDTGDEVIKAMAADAR